MTQNLAGEGESNGSASRIRSLLKIGDNLHAKLREVRKGRNGRTHKGNMRKGNSCDATDRGKEVQDRSDAFHLGGS